MYRVRPAQGERWQVWNEQDEVVFTGTLEECRDFLDHRENRLAQTRFQPSWIRHIRRLIPWFRKASSGEDEETKSVDSQIRTRHMPAR